MHSCGVHDTFLHNYEVYRFVLDLDTDIVLTQDRLLYISGPSLDLLSMYFKALLCSATVSFVRCSGTGSAGEVFCGGRVLQLQGPSPKGIRSDALEV